MIEACAVKVRTYADGAALALGNVEVLTVQLGTLGLGAEGDAAAALAQPARVHAVHLSLGELLPVVDALGRDWREETRAVRNL